MKDALVVIDVVNDFGHADGEALLDSFRRAQPALSGALDSARRRGVPVIYVNDNHGAWYGDASDQLQRALDGPAGDVFRAVAPEPGEPVLLKPRYSAFDHTPLDLLLSELGVERVLLAGAATEMCVVQTAIDAKEHRLKVSILADACASVSPRMAGLALEYAREIVGARIESSAILVDRG